MSEIRIRGALRVKPGQLEEFKALSAAMMKVSRERDQRTLEFTTYLNEDNGVWIALERYPDSDALFEHWAHQDQDLKARLLQTCEPMPLELYGTPSARLLDALSQYTPAVFAPLDRLRP